MKKEFNKYFIPNDEASWVNTDGERRLVAAISYRGKKTKRNKMAHDQSALPTVPVEQIISYVNELLDALKDGEREFNLTEIELDGINHKVIGNCIIVENCKWKETIWNGTYDKKYDVIKEKFDLNSVWDIVWLKFSRVPNSDERYLGVVALGNDINFSYDSSAGKLLTEVGQEWDESFVCIFPLTKKILKYKKRREIETGVGNYLVDKGVPIIDYYSHNNFN